MTASPPKRGFATRPGDPETWIKAADATPVRAADPAVYSARLTIDVTPDQRARIKIAAFGRGVTVADMLRELLAREFPQRTGDAT
ncbi:hypothetical protein HNP52_004018 [Sphingomonas kyeonggiensis]|uniref:Plasmid segregation centromere-binding protein ParG n=1 Tax=Sphingomonas kyeonggiensis TaxID=1268553 RepID=A0A7W7K5I1_9SPHN|nr:hypothetical protein [Sphingomonas kyeonggiensis]MBB4840921.1 hypothetical protein [Sphingomonas kyeonggiensis]